MSISFQSVPTTLRIPFVAVEFDNSKASQGAGALPFRTLLIAQKTGGTAAPNSLQRVTNADEVIPLAGRGSQAHRMAKKYFQNNQFTETWLGLLADSASAVVASGTVLFAGTATAAGTLSFYVGGELVPVAVAVGDTAATVAGNLATAIGKHASGTVTFSSADAADNITIAGTTEGGEAVSVTFVGATGAASPGAATYSIDTGDNAAAASFALQVNSHADASKLVRASNSSAIVTLRAVRGGTAGNAHTLAVTDPVDTAISGATLSGGAAAYNEDLPVHASVTSATVTVRAKNAGPAGNDIDMRMNYQRGEATPAGLTVTITALSAGATNPTLTTLIANTGDRWFHVAAHPYLDSTSLTALEQEFLSRAGPLRRIDGELFTSSTGTVSALGTLGDSRNSQFSGIVAQPGRSPVTPPCEFAAGLAGVVAYYAPNDQGLPFGTLPILGVLPPADADLFTDTERNQLLYDGISTTKAVGGQVVIERLCTTYQTNAAGAADESFYDMNTMFTLQYLRWSFANWIQVRYARAKLMDDGNPIPAGQSVITPAIGKAEACSWFKAMQELLLVENFDQFKRDIVCERSTTDANRMNWLLPPDLINQFIVGAAKLQFRK